MCQIDVTRDGLDSRSASSSATTCIAAIADVTALIAIKRRVARGDRAREPAWAVVAGAPQLALAAPPTGVRAALAEMDQIDQHAARQHLRRLGERGDAGIGVAGEHHVEAVAFAFSDARVARQRQVAPLAVRPELLERHLEQRQGLGGAIWSGFADQALDEIDLDVDADDFGGARDRQPQRRAAQRCEFDAVILEVVPGRAAHQVAVEVGPHAEQDRHPGHEAQRGELRRRTARVLRCSSSSPRNTSSSWSRHRKRRGPAAAATSAARAVGSSWVPR